MMVCGQQEESIRKQPQTPRLHAILLRHITWKDCNISKQQITSIEAIISALILVLNQLPTCVGLLIWFQASTTIFMLKVYVPVQSLSFKPGSITAVLQLTRLCTCDIITQKVCGWIECNQHPIYEVYPCTILKASSNGSQMAKVAKCLESKLLHY